MSDHCLRRLGGHPALTSRAAAPAALRRTLASLAVVAGVAALPAATTADAQDWRTLNTRRQVAGERELRVDLQFGVGRLRIEPAAAGDLYHAAIRYDAETFEPVATYKDGVLNLRIGGTGRSKRKIREGSQMTLGLGPNTPLDLRLAFGAVEADIELGGLALKMAEISTGASETKINFSRPNRERLKRLELAVGAAAFTATGLGNANADRIVFNGGVGDIILDFGGTWRGDTQVEVAMGMGSLTLRLPRDVGIHIERDTFLVSFEPRGLEKRGNEYYSKGWEQAERRLKITLKGALGSVDIRWLPDDMTRID